MRRLRFVEVGGRTSGSNFCPNFLRRFPSSPELPLLADCGAVVHQAASASKNRPSLERANLAHGRHSRAPPRRPTLSWPTGSDAELGARAGTDKGGRLVAVTTDPRLTRGAFRVVPQPPKLGTGKTDHRALERLR